MSTSWRRLGSVDPESLVETRLQLHYAIQLVTAATSSLLPAQDDDSHTTLTYISDNHTLSSEIIRGEKPFRLGLTIPKLEILFLDPADKPFAKMPLVNRTFKASLRQLSKVVHQMQPSAPQVRKRVYPDFPAHPLAEGATFAIHDEEHLVELDYYFGNTFQLLEEIKKDNIGSSPIRVWPETLDMAVLIAVQKSEGKDGKSMVVGLCPGDDTYGEPYFYVSPRPYPAPETLPRIDTPGHWHTDGFTAAILTASETLEATNRRKLAAEFLHSMIAACEHTLAI